MRKLWKWIVVAESLVIVLLLGVVAVQRYHMRGRFEQIIDSHGQLAFDRETGQRCWTAEPHASQTPETIPQDEDDDWFKDFRRTQGHSSLRGDEVVILVSDITCSDCS
jgi:hypothetical protein